MTADIETLSFEVAWAEVGGPYKAVGRPHLVVRAAGFLIADEDRTPLMPHSGNATILTRARPDMEQWVEITQELTEHQIREVANAILRSDWLDRAPDVEPHFDTGDSWGRLDVRLSLEHHRMTPARRSNTFSVHENCTGFDGPDAPALRALLRDVIRLAGPAAEYLLDESMYRQR